MIKDVNGIEIKIGAQVYDLSVEKMMEDYGPPDAIEAIDGYDIVLSNGHVITWKGEGYLLPVAVCRKQAQRE